MEQSRWAQCSFRKRSSLLRVALHRKDVAVAVAGDFKLIRCIDIFFALLIGLLSAMHQKLLTFSRMDFPHAKQQSHAFPYS